MVLSSCGWTGRDDFAVTGDAGVPLHFKHRDIEKAFVSPVAKLRQVAKQNKVETDALFELLKTILSSRPEAEQKKGIGKEIAPSTLIPFSSLLDQAPYAGDKRLIELVVMAVSNVPGRNPIFLNIIGPTGSGKTRACELVDCSARYADRFHKITPSALEGGSRNTDEQEKTFNLVEYMNGRTLIIDDMTSVLSGDPRSIEKTLSTFTTTYGDGSKCASPGGPVQIEGSYNLIAGMVPEKLGVLIKASTNLGQRFLIEYHEPSDSMEHAGLPVVEWQGHLIATLDDARKRPLPEIPSELHSIIVDYTKQICALRSYMNEMVEGHGRLLSQLETLIALRARLYQREPEFDDFLFVKNLAMNTIPYIRIFKLVRMKAPKIETIYKECNWISHDKIDGALARFIRGGVMMKNKDRFYLAPKWDIISGMTPEFREAIEQGAAKIVEMMKKEKDDDGIQEHVA